MLKILFYHLYGFIFCYWKYWSIILFIRWSYPSLSIDYYDCRWLADVVILLWRPTTDRPTDSDWTWEQAAVFSYFARDWIANRKCCRHFESWRPAKRTTQSVLEVASTAKVCCRRQSRPAVSPWRPLSKRNLPKESSTTVSNCQLFSSLTQSPRFFSQAEIHEDFGVVWGGG